MYTIIDIETTGGSPVSERITEIAVFVFDGKNIVDQFVSLINPERQIPYYITQLTGISNSMVADAPKFYEIAKQIVEMTEGKIFVAHNASFDYSFIKNEFKNLGYNFHREKLCTVNLSRKYLPGYKSYSLGKICGELGIVIEGRHRAAGDAFATVKLFEIILNHNKDSIESQLLSGLSQKDLNPNLEPKKIRSIPDEAGVYYFYNDKHDLIYIGKSKNLHTRVLSHFRNTKSKKAIEMRNAIADLDYELTGNDLIAQLKESAEIKQNKPVYNRAQRRAVSHYGLYHYSDSKGYIRFEIAKNTKQNAIPLCSFSGAKSGKSYMQRLVDKYTLCQRLCGLYTSTGSCFQYEIMECKGACIGKELPEDYNKRAELVIESHKYNHQSFFIIDYGRNPDELSVVSVDNGKYRGYGFIEKQLVNGNGNIEVLFDCIKKENDDRDIQQIIRNYLKTSNPIDIIKL
ncbi:MAG: GIY-YIG nuclease family protein [Bacteroidales bacterium]|nr:GIY-YIG nuclease family protein [Bacteroidales bacterium]MBN2821294.1 GIY-YIG nuclease family protein [Bacteroidales bacterium]